MADVDLKHSAPAAAATRRRRAHAFRFLFAQSCIAFRTMGSCGVVCRCARQCANYLQHYPYGSC
eukprot:IDg4761t1